MDIPISKDLAVEMANYAVKLCFVKTGWKSTLSGLYPIAEEGNFGIGIHPWARHLYYQNKGIQPFTMWALKGKLIPLHLPGGKVIFRYATHVGEPGKINKRDPKTGQILAGNTGIRWRHPGLRPRNFIEESMDETVKHFAPVLQIQASMIAMAALGGKSD